MYDDVEQVGTNFIHALSVQWTSKTADWAKADHRVIGLMSSGRTGDVRDGEWQGQSDFYWQPSPQNEINKKERLMSVATLFVLFYF